jgi:DNA-binding transcriptional ArsR family regulator
MSALRNPPGPGKELPRMSEVGRTIFKIVKEQPGIHFRGLGRAANLTSAGQLRHHLDRLERQGLLVELEDGRYKRFFVAGDHDRTLRPGLARFARSVPRKIGKLLLVHPMNRTELRRSLGCADSTLGYHLKRMMEQGDLEKNRGRNCCQYSLTNAELVQKVLMLQGAETGWEDEEAETAAALQTPGTLAPIGAPAAPHTPAELPALGTLPRSEVPALAAAAPDAPEPDEPVPEPTPDPVEPVEIPHDLGEPAPAVKPMYLLPTSPETEEPVPEPEPEQPQDTDPMETPPQAEANTSTATETGIQKVQEP